MLKKKIMHGLSSEACVKTPVTQLLALCFCLETYKTSDIRNHEYTKNSVKVQHETVSTGFIGTQHYVAVRTGGTNRTQPEVADGRSGGAYLSPTS